MERVDPPATLLRALNFRVSEVLRWDLIVGLLGAGGGIWLALASPQALGRVLPIAATVVGIVIGAVLAGVAILAAFLDQSFLRKLRAIQREPVRYIAPFLFTATLGVFAALLILVMVALPRPLATETPAWLRATLGGLTGLCVVWTIASVLPNLNTLVQFLGLQYDASDVPEIVPGGEGAPGDSGQESISHTQR
jgi:hypothetical protein